MSKATGLVKRDNGTYYFSRRVPADIADAYSGQFVRRSLKTKDRPTAMKAFHRVAEEVDAEFERHRAARRSQVDDQRPERHSPSFAEIARQYASEVTDAEFVRRADLYEKACNDPGSLWKGKLTPTPVAGDRTEKPENQYRYFDHLAAEGDIDAGVGYLIRTRVNDRIAALRRMLAVGDMGALTTLAHDRAPGLDDSRYTILARLLAQAEIKALHAIATGEADVNISQSVPGAQTGTSGAAEQLGPLFSVAFETRKKNRLQNRKWKPKSQKSFEAAARDFITVCGDKQLNAYEKADAERFIDVLFDVPPNAHKMKQYAGLGIVEIAEKAAAEGVKKPSVTTVSAKVESVSAIFKAADRTRDKNRDPQINNPFDGIKPERDKNRRTARDSLTLEEIGRIFRGPPYTGARSKHYWLQPGNIVLNSTGKYWVPFIALYTGARLMEIVQLRKCDILTERNISYIAIREEEPENFDESSLSAKTDTALRKIPVHPALKKAGFLEFVERISKPRGRLFDDIPIGPPDNRSKDASQMFNKLLAAVGVKRKKNCFHSFRHSFEDACREAGIDSRVMDALQGHSDRGMSGTYGHGYSVAVLNDAIQKITYELDFEN